MRASYIAIVALLVCTLASCSLGAKQPASISATSQPTVYQYEYETVNTRADCGPDDQTFAGLLAYSLNPTPSGYDSIAQKVAAIVSCTQNRLQDRLSQRGAVGWKLVAFEALTPTQSDFGIEYSYRLVWEKQE